MWYRFLLTCVVLGSVAVIAAQDTRPDRQNTALLVRMFEREMTLRPTAGPHNIGNCLTVASDGRAHLELRRQEFGDGHATLATYERSLTQQELERLRGILDSDLIRSLPELAQPSMLGPSWHGVSVEIYRLSGMQRIGYFDWLGKAPANAPSAEKKDWLRSADAMKSVVLWFHMEKSRGDVWKRAANRDGVCGE